MDSDTNKKVKYDLLFVLSPVLAEDKANEETTRISKIIESHGGTIFGSDAPKLRPLSYPVAKTWEGKKTVYEQGLFGWTKFEIDSIEIPAIQKEFQAIQHLLRSAITYAYLDVRPVRRIPTEDKPEEVVVSSLPPELVSVPTATPVARVEAEPIKKLSEAEIDKQIESLLS
ncbi:MAG: 30S ribosomal protein S6 [Candidatus Paceibacterota bacterium]|jgi:ribosomal protein S6